MGSRIYKIRFCSILFLHNLFKDVSYSKLELTPNIRLVLYPLVRNFKKDCLQRDLLFLLDIEDSPPLEALNY